MRLKKLLALSLAISMCGFSLFASGNTEKNSNGESSDSSKETISIYSYNVDDGKKLNDEIVQILEEKYNCNIEIIHRADGTGVELKTMAASGDLPDIFEVAGPSVCDALINSNNILALDDIIKAKDIDKVIDTKKYVWPRKSGDGKTYVLKYIYPETYMIMYNNDVFEKYGVKVPTNYDEFKDAVIKFRANNIIPFSLFGAEPWPGVAFYEELVTRIDPRGFVGLLNGESEITDSAFVTAIKQLEELSSLGFVSKSAASTNASMAFEYLKTGKAAMSGNGTWYLRAMPALGDSVSYLVNPLSVPGKEAETSVNHVGGAVGPKGFGINPKSENLELTEDILFDYVYYRAKLGVLNDGLPNILVEDVQPTSQRPVNTEKYAKHIPEIENVTYFPNSIPNVNIQTALFDNVNAVIAGVMSADEFISETNKVIQEYR